MEKDKKNQNVELDETRNKKKSFTILGISIWRVFAYFVIYSFLGYIIETIFGIVTKGVWESRQSFLYGPFCAIYGVGACIMIIFLHKYKKKYNLLFVGGFIVGSIVEYLLSLILELMLGVRWWDYSNMPLNIQGRICVYYSFFWGFLGMYLIGSLNVHVDKFINWLVSKFKTKVIPKTITLILIIFLFLDCVATAFAVSFFLIREIEINNINVENKQQVSEQYEKIYGNEDLSNFIYTFWGDYKMLRTFPNLKVTDTEGNIVYIDSLLKDIQPYYLKTR